MGWVILFGLMLVVVGLTLQVVFDLVGVLLLVGGIIAAIAGGAALVLGRGKLKLYGFAALSLGMAAALTGVFLRFLQNIWLVRLVIDYGATILLVVGLIIVIVGLIGLFRARGPRHDSAL